MIFCCASAIASIEAFREEGVVENAAAMGAWFGEALRSLHSAEELGARRGVKLVSRIPGQPAAVPAGEVPGGR